MDANAEKRKIAFALLAICLLAAVVWAWRSGVNERNKLRVTLANGYVVEYLGAAYGANIFTTETKWQRLARKYLPKKLTGWIPRPISGGSLLGTFNYPGPEVFLQVTGPPLWGEGEPWVSIRTEDESGGICGINECATFLGGRGKSVTRMLMRSFPRRRPWFWLDMVDSSGASLGRLRVPNPDPGPFPTWPTLPLPQTLTNGPVQLTLESITQAGRPGWPYLVPKFSVKSKNPEWAKAEPQLMDCSDATGNVCMTADDPLYFSPNEPACKLHVWLSRGRWIDFDNEEQLVLTNFPIPQHGEFLTIDRKTNICDVGVDITYLAGARQVSLSNGVMFASAAPPIGTNSHSLLETGTNVVETWMCNSPTMLVEFSGAGAKDEIWEWATDQDGQKVDLCETTPNSSTVEHKRFRLLTLRPNSTSKTLSVRLVLVFNGPLLFDFMVNPQDVFSNTAVAQARASQRAQPQPKKTF